MAVFWILSMIIMLILTARYLATGTNKNPPPVIYGDSLLIIQEDLPVLTR